MNAPIQPILPVALGELRTGLAELINICPVDQCNPVDCPLFPLRKMNYGRRLEWFALLERADLEYLAVYHYVCMNIKLGKRGQVPVSAGQRLRAGPARGQGGA